MSLGGTFSRIWDANIAYIYILYGCMLNESIIYFRYILSCALNIKTISAQYLSCFFASPWRSGHAEWVDGRRCHWNSERWRSGASCCFVEMHHFYWEPALIIERYIHSWKTHHFGVLLENAQLFCWTGKGFSSHFKMPCFSGEMMAPEGHLYDEVLDRGVGSNNFWRGKKDKKVPWQFIK